MRSSLASLLFIAIAANLFSCRAESACANPAGVAGQLAYKNVRGGITYSRVEYCDGTSWHDTAWETSNTKCTAALSGQITYTSASSNLQFCDGSYYVTMKGMVIGAGCGTGGTISYNSSTNVYQYCGNDGNWRSMTACKVYLTSTGLRSFTVPSDWSSSYNKIEVIAAGGGAGGGGNGTNAGSGGGGGGYSEASDVTLTASGVVSYAVGAGGAGGLSTSSQNGRDGGDTYFCNSTSNCATINGTSVVAGATGGDGGLAAAGAGGAGGGGKPIGGNVTYLGGTGGVGQTGTGNRDGGGGGGAGGPYGSGLVGQNGGGTNVGGRAGGTRGGAGGAAGNPGGTGKIGNEWSGGAVTYGSGGGGGGANSSGNNGGAGGGYGGGGGGSSVLGTGGAGSNGLIVLTYSNGSATTECDKFY